MRSADDSAAPVVVLNKKDALWYRMGWRVGALGRWAEQNPAAATAVTVAILIAFAIALAERTTAPTKR